MRKSESNHFSQYIPTNTCNCCSHYTVSPSVNIHKVYENTKHQPLHRIIAYRLSNITYKIYHKQSKSLTISLKHKLEHLLFSII